MKTYSDLIVVSLFVSVFFFESCSSKNDSGEIYVMKVLQLNNKNEFGDGELSLAIVDEITEDRTQKELMNRMQIIESHMLKIDSLSGDLMHYLESIKLEMFRGMGEDLSAINESNVLYYDYGKEKKSRPISYKLDNVKYSGGTDILESKKAQNIIDSMRYFRGRICEMIENSVYVEKNLKPYYFKDPNINNFKNYKDFTEKFDKALNTSNVTQDDKEAIKEIYFGLSKSDDEWKQILNKKKSWINAYGVLLVLQNDILYARRSTFLLLRSRFCIGEYGFSQIIPIVKGPEVAEIGDTIQLQVFYGAINVNKTPEVIVFNGGQVVGSKNGLAFIEVPIQKGKELKVEGSITVRNKSGVPKTENWSKRIVVIPNQ